jgi:hypothetical protein
VLRTDDAGVVAIRPNTEFVAERFAAEDKPSDGFTVRLLTGSLRVISGWIGQTNKAGQNIVTPRPPSASAAPTTSPTSPPRSWPSRAPTRKVPMTR